MSTSAVWVARKRRRAREAGLCTRCCIRRPQPERAICSECNAATALRVRRSRQRAQAALQSHRLLLEIEQAGDLANDHHLHADAARYFEDALHIQDISSADSARISDKLGRTLAFGADPNAADPWFERALKLYRDETDAERSVDVLLLKARQLELDCRAESALPVVHEAVRASDVSGKAQLRKKARVSMAHFLLNLHRTEAARSYLDAAGRPSGRERGLTGVVYYRLRGILSAEAGDAEAAYQNYERALTAAKRDLVRDLPLVWRAYGASALQLGDMSLAPSCYRQALDVARDIHVVWLIQWICLEYANLLHIQGKLAEACRYLHEALSYGVQAAAFETELAKNGVGIAIQAKDDELLARCIKPAMMSAALRSGEPERIAGVAAAFAEWHVANGRRSEAQRLLHHAIGKLGSVREVWLFPIAVARYGALPDVPRARSFIARRASRPNANVAEASLQLFDAYVSRRQGSPTVALKASRAACSFETLGWHAYAALAKTLLPRSQDVSHSGKERADGAAALVPLTSREQLVASLALKGLTNRAIGAALSISENTVESHMKSILNRLGLHSRHQLRDVLAK